MKNVLVVLCTCPNRDEATRLGRALVDRRLAACANVLPQVQSIYRWQGSVETAEEVLLLLKTTSELFESVRTYIEQAHSYDVPEVLALSVQAGNASYLEWVAESVSPPPQEI